MAKKPVYEFELDDEDEDTKEFLYTKYMEDIAEIMSRAYNDIEEKVRALVDALKEEEE